jgi:UDP-N-acetylglucosamine 2-epimerase (non-hydrolysing)/GDP/UDP-N,N'-diacetylbacillosamine 2-epimerase (hydrolysing)
METASFALPTVNIGMRQQGREQPLNVLDAAADAEDIVNKLKMAMSAEFRSSLNGMSNPYGEGHAAEKIAEVLATVTLEQILVKAPVPLPLATES